MLFFFYGTLMDSEVCRIVLGARAEAMRAVPAVLPGYRRVRAKSAGFPVLVRRSGGRVRGQLITGLDRTALSPIAHFEGPDYAPRRVLIIEAAGGRRVAWVFQSEGRGRASAEAWDLRRWQQRHKARLLPQLRRWMAEPGAGALESSDVRWHIRRRIGLMQRNCTKGIISSGRD